MIGENTPIKYLHVDMNTDQWFDNVREWLNNAARTGDYMLVVQVAENKVVFAAGVEFSESDVRLAYKRRNETRS